MNDSIRFAGVLGLALMLTGCGESARKSMNTRTYYGAFNMIVFEVENMDQQVNQASYDGRFSPVEDQLGSAIAAFMRNEDVKGTPLEAEAQKLADKEQEIVQIWESPDGTLEKLRAAVKEMRDQVELMKTMI